MDKMMNDPGNSLRALWQSEAPAFSAAEIIAGIDKHFAFQRQFLRGTVAGTLVVLAVIIWFDIEGMFIVPGAMTGLVSASLGWTLLKAWRAGRNCPPAVSMAPRELLAHALKHAKAALNAARSAYGLLPLGVLTGIAAGPFLANSEAELSAPKWAGLLVAAGLGAMTIAIAIWGLIQARRKKAEVDELKARIAAFDEDV